MSLLVLDKVSVEYGDQLVLEDLCLRIDEGAFCTIVGASGCGKSTFLRLLLGQEGPTRGRILMDGQPLPVEPSINRGIVFQRYSVFPHLTVRQNVLLGLELTGSRWLARLFGARRRAAQTQAERLVEQVGLSAALDKYPAALSGGMQQRLAIAQSLVMQPRVLLLDEPFGALDPGIRRDMHRLIHDLWRETGTTIFMVTHDLREGFQLGTRLLVFDKVRHDPHEPHRYGASVTYDLPLRGGQPDKAVLNALPNWTAPDPALAAATGATPLESTP